MKNNYILNMMIIALLSTSCSQESDKDVNSEELQSEVTIQYSDLKSNIQKGMDLQAEKLGLIKTKSDSESSFMDIILQMSPESLQSFVSEYESNGLLEESENRQYEIIEEFQSIFSDKDYIILKEILDVYTKEGGHNTTLLFDICQNIPSNLVDGCIYMCAYSDALVSKELWMWLNETLPNYSILTRGSAMEMSCREAF